ncbi:MAG: histidinol-phosphate transaminase [Nitrospiraceae bacterium]|nr:histidinol-phosphate transaminase [Nitrospiraceae bacterium]
MIKAPAHVLKVKPYVPGKPVEELERELGITQAVKLASNENPIGPSKLAIEAAAQALAGVNRYPDGGGFKLKQKLSGIHNISSGSIILGNGSNELLDVAVRTFMGPGDEAVMARPSFVVYAASTTIQGGVPVEIPLKDHRHDLEAMAKAVTPRTRMVFIANPNNPTGTINTRDEYERFFRLVPEDVLVVLDEAYFEYAASGHYPDGLEYLRNGAGRNVLVLRTFSKAYGLAGLRIGYGIAHPDVIGQMERARPPFNTSVPAQAAAYAALDDQAHIEKSRLVNEQGKEYLYRELDKLGAQYVRTEANFIYMPFDNAAPAYEKLLREGVIIRPAGPNALRVTIGLEHENEKFIKSFKKLGPVSK